ncbi:MAG: undecaprenyl-phosphate glucose phosphotransferase [Planctomycetes bacterium]|nr:undecaprenyl-phosphate glucose phosphotransferase [Planctomycetota bacterium]
MSLEDEASAGQPERATPRSILLEISAEPFTEPVRRATADASLVFLTLVRIVDALGVGCAAVAAYVFQGAELPHSTVLTAAFAGGALAVQRLGRRDSYALPRLRELGWQLRQVTGGWAVAFALLLGLAYLTRNLAALPRPWLGLWFALGLCALFLVRAFVWLRLHRAGAYVAQVAVVGRGAPLEQLRQQALVHADVLALSHVIDPDDEEELAGLAQAVRDGNVDEVVLALGWDERERLALLLGRFRALAVNLRFFPYVSALGLPSRGFTEVGGIPLFRVYERPLSGWQLLSKSAFDRLVAAALLLAFAPLLLLVAAAIKLTSPGPVFFRQRRWGFNGNEILVFKFRSMHQRPVDDAQVVQATRGDPRVSRVGAILRRTSLDELPQLLNVLWGDMSLVGPRPHAVAHNVHYAQIIDGYLARHRVKPGITGWAQINGARGETDTPEKMQRRVDLDLYYIDRCSLLFDAKILIMTPYALFRGDAY